MMTVDLFMWLLIVISFAGNWAVDVSYMGKYVDDMKCLQLKDFFGVSRGVAFGSLPEFVRNRWKDQDCDSVISRLLSPPNYTFAQIEAMDCDTMQQTFGIVLGLSFGGLQQYSRTHHIWGAKKCDALLTERAHNPGEDRPTIFPTAKPTFEHEYSGVTNVTTVIAECDAGISNRVRALMFFMYYTQWKYNGAKLKFVWDVNDACPGRFLDLFSPLPHVEFISSVEARQLETSPGVLRFRNTYKTVHQLTSHFKTPVGDKGILHRYLPDIALTTRVLRQVEAFVREHNICGACSTHVRRTDLKAQLAEGRSETYMTLFGAIEKHCSGMPVFLATDNAETQRIFLRHYEHDHVVVPRAFVFRMIDGEKAAATIASGTVSSEFRHTDLETSIIDLYILSYAKHFRETMHSSYSEWARWLHHRQAKLPSICEAKP